MKIRSFLLLFGLSYGLPVFISAQQSVVISPQPVPQEPSAILQIQSNNQGILIPKTTPQSIPSPVNGLMIYDTTQHLFKYFKDSVWVSLLESTSFFLSYADHDGDQFGDPLSALYAPFMLPGYFTGLDCDDDNPSVYPGQPELCDNLDNDCDPLTPDGVGEPTFGVPCDGSDSDLCQEGFYICVNGVLTCSDNTGGTPELCDGFDNDCDGTIDENCPIVDIDFAILQFPPAILILPGNTGQIYGRVYSQGSTEGPGQGPGVTAQLGYGPNGSDPQSGGWTWVAATYNTDVGNEDEYVSQLNVTGLGLYDYAYRFSGNYGVTWTYADLNGTADGYQIANAGDLEVTDDLCNGIDDDDDGFIDENCPDLGLPCDGEDSDECLGGVVICLPNGDCGCSDDAVSIPEICNGVDDDCDDLVDEGCEFPGIDFAILQFPSSIFMLTGLTPDVYGRIYVLGVTEAPGQGPGILAQAGYGPDNSDPAMGGWTWFTATYNTDVGNEDEYKAMLNVPVPGIYDYAYRFSTDFGATWTYADLNGTSNGYQVSQAGDLEAVDDLCNGLDDDGDNLVDEGCPTLGQPCDGPDTDMCPEGVIVCLPNGDCGCDDFTSSTTEICNGIDDDCNGLIDDNCPPVVIDWGNLQFPQTITMPPGNTQQIYGRVYSQGVTDMPGPGIGIMAQVGYGTDGSDPSMGGWNWFTASYNADVGNDDEYVGVMNVPVQGQFDYAYRYSGDGGVTWLYCDYGSGSADGYTPANAGQLTVN